MKRLLALLLAGTLCCGMLAGCSNTQKSEPPLPGERPASGEAAAPQGARPEATGPATAQTGDGIVDLTLLSSTMVFAEVYAMKTKPESYVGKTIKMNGLYYAGYNPDLDVYYHFVIVEDATACCAQGLEFRMNGAYTYPGDYPDDQTPVEVTGVWSSYLESGTTFYYIAADELTVL